MAKQLLLFHTAISAYFSGKDLNFDVREILSQIILIVGNQEALEESMKQFNNKVQMKNPPSSWIEQ